MSKLTRTAKNIFLEVGEIAQLFVQFVKATFTRPFYFHRVMEQVVELGVRSLSITVVIGLVMGLVMTLQFGFGLSRFGGTLYVPAIVANSLVRSMAPIFTSLLIAGRIGSGIAAEIGSMSVTQQIDAIRALGTSPVRVLVVPRILAALISLPLLSLFSAFLGMVGGMFACYVEFNMSPSFYVNKILDTIGFIDVFSGFVKTYFFALVITLFACHKGFKTKDGTRGVGEATTWVVVASSITILVSDYFLTKIMFLVLDEY